MTSLLRSLQQFIPACAACPGNRAVIPPGGKCPPVPALQWWHWGGLGKVGHTGTSRTGGTGTAPSPPFPSHALARGGCLHRKGTFITPAGKGQQQAAKSEEDVCGFMLSGPPALEAGRPTSTNRARFGGAKTSELPKHPLARPLGVQKGQSHQPFLQRQ